MLQHHEASIENLIKYFKGQEGVVALILGGSVAKGLERPDSDLDAMVILDDAAYERRVAAGETVEIIRGHSTYEAGYFDVKYMNKHFLRVAAKQASEPTRNSFVKARVLFSADEEIDGLVSSIGRYPTEEKQEKIMSFMGYIGVDAYYFWTEAERADDLFLKVRTASNIVLYGLRMILAHNEILFPCARGLMRAVEGAPHKPDNIIQLAQDFLTKLDAPSKDAFVMSVLGFTDWGVSLQEDFSRVHSLYTDNNEQWWLTPRPLVAEW